MGDFLIYHFSSEFGVITGQYIPDNLSFSIRNSEPGTISYEIPLSEPFLTRDQFGPYRTDWKLYHRPAGGDFKILEGGILTEVNLDMERETILVNGKSWLHYLERRMYPFDPVAYVSDRDWVSWPKQWPTQKGNDAVDLTVIVEEILQAMIDEDVNGLPLTLGNIDMGSTGFYKIFPADQTSIYDHVKRIAEIEDGFEFEINPTTLKFKMYPGTRDDGDYLWFFVPENADEVFNGAVIRGDWTNSGPISTWLVGYGAGSKIKKGAVSTFARSREVYRRLERAEDFGEVSSQTMMNRLTASQGYQDRFPQKKLNLVVLNPEYMLPGFYEGGRPRNIIGRRINFFHNFEPYHNVNAAFRIIGLNWTVDQHGNEEVEFDVEMINDPNLT